MSTTASSLGTRCTWHLDKTAVLSPVKPNKNSASTPPAGAALTFTISSCVTWNSEARSSSIVAMTAFVEWLCNTAPAPLSWNACHVSQSRDVSVAASCVPVATSALVMWVCISAPPATRVLKGVRSKGAVLGVEPHRPMLAKHNWRHSKGRAQQRCSAGCEVPSPNDGQAQLAAVLVQFGGTGWLSRGAL